MIINSVSEWRSRWNK